MDKFMQWQEHLTMSQVYAIVLSIFICALVVFTLVDDIRSRHHADRDHGGDDRSIRTRSR